MPSGQYEVDELINETDDAWLVSIDNEEFWLPKSQCDMDDPDDPDWVTIPDWLAEKKGLM
jgi:hypothetical protein